MAEISYLKFIFALLIVLGLLYGCLWVLKRFGIGQAIVTQKKREKQLSLLEVLPLDGRRKLMRIREGDNEHLILNGPNNDLHISTKPHQKNDGEAEENGLN